jgi:lipooligosaccharide transport system permease protein
MKGEEPPGFPFGMYQVAARNLIVWRSYLAPSALGNFGEPMLYLLALGFGLGAIVPEIGGMSYAEFIAPGLIVSTVMYTSTFEATFGTYTRLASQKTFEAILATPITVPEIVAGEVLFCGVKAAFGAASVLIVIALFGLVPSWLSLAVVPLGFVGGLMFGSMALVMTAISRSYEFFNYYFTLLVAPMFLFSGIFFPLDRAPRWASLLAEVLPLTHVVRLSRALVRGEPSAGLLLDFGIVLAVLVVAYTVAFSLLRSRLRI